MDGLALRKLNVTIIHILKEDKMTTEEIEKAAEEYTSNLRVELNKEMAASWFFIGAMYSNTNWQEKTRWIPIEEKLPPIGTKVIVKYKDYENEDYFILNYSGDINELSFINHWKEIE